MKARIRDGAAEPSWCQLSLSWERYLDPIEASPATPVVTVALVRTAFSSDTVIFSVSLRVMGYHKPTHRIQSHHVPRDDASPVPLAEKTFSLMATIPAL